MMIVLDFDSTGVRLIETKNRLKEKLFSPYLVKMAKRKRSRNTTRAIRMRYKARMKKMMMMDEINETASAINVVDKPKRVRYERLHPTSRNFNFNAENEAPTRTVVSTNCLLLLANSSVEHGKFCKEASFSRMRIVNGKIEMDCKGCKKTFVYSADDGLEKIPYEKALTMAIYTSGTGLESLNTMLATIQLPELSFYKYRQNEEIIYREMHEALEKEFAVNAAEEFNLAVENGSFIVENGDTIGVITVVVDGGWSKRSYRHSFSSKSGVAVIIGQRTKRVLFMDTRIKTCASCTRAANEGREAKNHTCFENWEESAQAMEADIIVEGFKKSMSHPHKLIYKYVVGDADSSVFHKIKSTIRYPAGVEIKKVDCVNHALRCLTTKLHGISKVPTFSKPEKDLIASKIPQISRDAKGAINYNSQLKDASSHPLSLPPAKRLFNDLINIPLHVFGDHRKCDKYFCQKVGSYEEDAIFSTKIYALVRNAVYQTAQKSDRLIYNVTSNLAEGFMSQVCKYTSGKRCFQSQSFGYPLRTMSAVFAYDHGSFWVGAVYKKYFSISVDSWNRKQATNMSYRRKTKPRKKIYRKAQERKKKGNNDYGEDAYDDVDTDILMSSVHALCQDLQVTITERDNIQRCTIGQAFNDEWKYHRLRRITASQAGKIFNMRDTTNSSNCIKSILYPVDLSKNANVRRGIDFEPLARKKYEEVTGISITECGLFIFLENGVLAASPDGLVYIDGQCGVCEIKCPSVRPRDLCNRKDRILVKDENDPDVFYLNKKHHYYYQVIAQIYIAEKSFCDFIIYYSGEDTAQDEIWIQRIQRCPETDNLWQKMKRKLVMFFTEDLAPEICRPRYPQNLPIRQPAYRKEASLNLITKKSSAAQRKGQKRPREEEEND